MNIFNKNSEISRNEEDSDNSEKDINIIKTKTILFKIIKEVDNVTVKLAYDYADNYIKDKNKKNYEVCKIDFDLSYFRDLNFEEIQFLTVHSNVTEIVNKYSTEEDRTPKEYYIVFNN